MRINGVRGGKHYKRFPYRRILQKIFDKADKGTDRNAGAGKEEKAQAIQ